MLPIVPGSTTVMDQVPIPPSYSIIDAHRPPPITCTPLPTEVVLNVYVVRRKLDLVFSSGKHKKQKQQQQNTQKTSNGPIFLIEMDTQCLLSPFGPASPREGKRHSCQADYKPI